MKRSAGSIFVLILIAAGFVVFLQKAEARGGGGFEGGRSEGMSREESNRDESVEGPRGGEAVEGPYGGVAAEGPRGNAAVAGPDGGVAAEGPRGNAAVAGPDGGVAAVGPRGNVAVGTRVNVLPETANQVYVGDQVYYVDSGVYYQTCDDSYCVVTAPPQDQGN
jgi:hypothetical protein